MATHERAEPWSISSPLRLWQEEALSAWALAGGRGVITPGGERAGGAVALAAMSQLHDRHGDNLRVVVVVPTIALARQWRTEIERGLSLRRSDVGEIHSQPQHEWTFRSPILLTVVNSARRQLARPLERWREDGRVVLLVVDECHRTGSQFNSRSLEGPYDHTLGLSATPERTDDGHEEFIYPALGQPVFRYPLLTALDDGVLAPLTSVNLYVELDPRERFKWDELTLDLSRAFVELRRDLPRADLLPEGQLFLEIARLAKLEVPAALKVLRLVSERRQLLADSVGRARCLHAISDWLKSSRVRALVFHEHIASAEEHHSSLLHREVRSALEHSGLTPDARREAASRFKSDRSQVLVAVRSLDEGIDVPDAAVAVIASGSKSVRQRIQRIGRVVRKAEGKNALVVSILVVDTPEEWAIGAREKELLGGQRVRHHLWPQTSVPAALASDHSTYEPRGQRDGEFNGLE